MKRKALGYYDYTVILTYCGMLFAFYGIMKVVDGEYWNAMVCLMLAGTCDMFDGSVARTKKRSPNEKRFGIQIDSLSDLISFGVLPGLFVYQIARDIPLAELIASLYVLSALIRLAYFNVLEEDRQNQTAEKRKKFMGLPVTTAAIVLPFVYVIYDFHLINSVVYFPVLLAVMGVGFLSPIEIKKPAALMKICILILGILELVGMAYLAGYNTK